ncbi:ORF94 protein [Operophtera brumata nucleopolyhedrovirus]|uniref:ORF94 protein n=1 Tax=Operophtera brumata nucleopolyhedrovirus TaxID=1046267 RepID=A0A2H4UZY7_9ABAC|nr:ORF94 protein [Operophtera brumata nucleopolyhedrovirus]AUA60325.1 ORF94 protein [Operophtera brumata nucleopolyhedrovirus]
MIFSVVVLLFFVQALVKMAHSLFNNYLMGINEDEEDFIDDNEEEYDDDYEDEEYEDEEYEDEDDEGYIDDRESPIMTRSRSQDVEPNEEHYLCVLESLATPVIENAVLTTYQVPSRP